MKKTVSIIICTRNRAESLGPTLAAVSALSVPEGWAVEVLVVDNGSTDGTETVTRSARCCGAPVNYVHEPRVGKGYAYNTGLAAAQGEVLLFTDDDVRPVSDWIVRMVAPLAAGQCEAVVGAVHLASEVERPWMDQLHRVWLAAPDLTGGKAPELVGANMGFCRTVLDRVPAFDPELGPGGLGFGDETLFSMQLIEAGYRLSEVPEALVIHHPDASRLTRSHWLATAQKRGRTSAYLLHHWHHEAVQHPVLRAWYLTAKLRLRRVLQRPVSLSAEGCASWEMSYVHELEKCRHFLTERRRRRNYARRGLARLDMPRQVKASPVGLPAQILASS